MNRTRRYLLFASALVGFACAWPAHAEESMRPRVRGVVTDTSGAVLPGVTVTLSSPTSSRMETTVTDQEGRYEVAAGEPGTYRVSFELSGFATQRAELRPQPGQPAVLDRVLAIAGVQESVTVVADDIAAPLIEVPQPRAVPPAQPVTEHASVCGPRKAGFPPDPEPLARVAAVDEAPGRDLLGDRDVFLLDRGEFDGVAVGQNLVVRRRYVVNRDAGLSRLLVFADHTAALVQVVETDAHTATARAVYVCDEIAVGDRVEAFEPQPVWTAQDGGRPDFTKPARVLFVDEGRTVAAPTEFLVIDRGAEQGTRPGQRVTLFRKRSGREIDRLGEALVVSVQADSSTLLIKTARDAVEAGDRAALHR